MTKCAGLVLDLSILNCSAVESLKKVTNIFTQAVQLNWNFKIGAEINQENILILIETASFPIMGNGLMMIANKSIVSFVNLSK